jgi:hypothetical protein
VFRNPSQQDGQLLQFDTFPLGWKNNFYFGKTPLDDIQITCIIDIIASTHGLTYEKMEGGADGMYRLKCL